MEKRRLVDRAGVKILDRDRARRHQCVGISKDKVGGCDHVGAAGRTPDLDEMALARTDRSGEEHGTRGPVGPAIDQRDRLGVGSAGEEIGAVEPGSVRQGQGKLARRHPRPHFFDGLPPGPR
jgi:hypothetical protein